MQDFIPIFPARVENGKLVFDDRMAFQIWIEGLEGEVEVVVRKKKKRRTLDQNSYYFGVVLEVIAKETGHTPEELHEIFKRMFLTARTIAYRGKEVRVPGTTTTLSTKEFGDYVERIKVEAGGMGITIPDAGKVNYE